MILFLAGFIAGSVVMAFAAAVYIVRNLKIPM